MRGEETGYTLILDFFPFDNADVNKKNDYRLYSIDLLLT